MHPAAILSFFILLESGAPLPAVAPASPQPYPYEPPPAYSPPYAPAPAAPPGARTAYPPYAPAPYPSYPWGYPAPYARPAPPPPPAVPEGPKPGDFTHDGFYLRMALGPGGLAGTSSSSAFLAEFAAGLSLTPRLVLAGGLYSATGIGNAKVKTGKGTVTGGVSAFPLFGVAADVYPDPRRGLHFEIVLAAGQLILNKNGTDWPERSSGIGVGAAVGGGYELWISPNWSLGGLLRVGFAKGNVSASSAFPTGDADVAVLNFGLLLGATYH